MSHSALFPLTNVFNRYWNALEESQGVVTDEIESLKTEIMAKGQEAAEQLQLIRDNADAYMEVLEARIDELTDRKKKFKKMQETAKLHLVEVMETLNLKTLALAQFTITLKPGSQSVEPVDLTKIPPRCLRATIKTTGDVAEKIVAAGLGKMDVKLEADKAELKGLVAQGVETVGIEIVTGPPTIQVRRK